MLAPSVLFTPPTRTLPAFLQGFLVATLVKHGMTLPTPYLLYFLTMTAVLICLLIWQHCGGASYLPWRDWVHFLLRFEAFYNPAQLYLAERTWASDSSASSLTILPVILLTSGTVQLFVLSFVHYVNLPSQLLLQSLCAARAAVAVFTSPWQESPFAQHPVSQQWLGGIFGWMQSFLGLFSRAPIVGPAKGCPWSQQAQNYQVVLMLVLYLGFVAPLSLQAALELRSYRAFCSQQHTQTAVAGRGGTVSAHRAADRLLDQCSAVLVPLLGQLATRPTVSLLLAVALWDALSSLLL